MASTAELNALTVKDLRKIACAAKVAGWHGMRKEELVRSLVQKSRTKAGRDAIQLRLQSPIAAASSKSAQEVPAKTSSEQKRRLDKERHPVSSRRKGNRDHRAGAASTTVPRGLALCASAGHNDQLVLLVRDSYWLQAYWELSVKTLKRAEVSLGHFWHSAFPVLRHYRIDSDGSSHPRRVWIRDFRIHGGVNHWYIDVDDPPSKFQVEVGYIGQGQKFHPLVSSNVVETPQRRIAVGLDGNWRSVEEDIGRIYRLSSGETNNNELKKVLEEQLGRSMSGTMLSRYRAARNKMALDKTRRNFEFNVDADLIIRGQTDPSVLVSIRNEPIPTGPDGTFLVRFPMPEKRTIFPIEAEGSDGVEMHRVVLSVERNTRVLETVFQEPTEED